MKEARKQLWIGAAIGLLSPAVFWGLAYTFTNLAFESNNSTEYILEAIYLKYLKVAVLINLLPFLYFVRKERDEICRGILLGTIITGLIFAIIILTAQ
jgi:hypothetical protein